MNYVLEKVKKKKDLAEIFGTNKNNLSVCENEIGFR